MFRFLHALFAALCLLAAPVAFAQARPPLVLAAASMQESLNAAADAWAAQGHPRPILSFAASSALARQIEAGAPADLFISADQDWMDAVAAKGLLRPRTRAPFLRNTLVLIGPAGQSRTVAIDRRLPLAAMLGNSRLAMADPDAVPAGKYGKAALQSLGLWRGVENRIARGDSVRAALALVERGQSPLGIVYATDARAASTIRIIGTFPASSHPPIVYPLATLKTSRSPDAEPFRRFLLSAKAKAIFRRFGFGA